MKKISKELYRSYVYMILFFVISYLGVVFAFISYIDRSGTTDIETLDSFLTYETNEFEKKINQGKDLNYLFKDALEECPEILGTNVIFLYDGEKFVKTKNVRIPDNIDKEVVNRIERVGYFNYQYLNKEIDIKGYNKINLIIIKDMASERNMIIHITLISGVIMLLSLFVSIGISRRFYREFANSLQNLQDITNNINLHTISKDFQSENKFIEFDIIIDSYKKMLNRLKLQTDAQLDFVNNASHELKTPIFIIGSYIKMIKRWGLENRDVSNEAIEAIEDETEVMNNLIQKLLFLAKGNVKEVEKQELQIKKIILDVVKELNIIYPKQKIEIKGKEKNIYSDKFLLRQLFFNLIENSIKYGRERDIYVEIIVDKSVQVKIVDNGEGIKESDLKFIYEKFYRVDKGRSREMKSHGLGMSIVKKITEILKIDIEILSKYGKGTTVILNVLHPKS